jgi:hypothetical protein
MRADTGMLKNYNISVGMHDLLRWEHKPRGFLVSTLKPETDELIDFYATVFRIHSDEFYIRLRLQRRSATSRQFYTPSFLLHVSNPRVTGFSLSKYSQHTWHIWHVRTALGVVCSWHCVINCIFVSIWGPGLALVWIEQQLIVRGWTIYRFNREAALDLWQEHT